MGKLKKPLSRKNGGVRESEGKTVERVNSPCRLNTYLSTSICQVPLTDCTHKSLLAYVKVDKPQAQSPTAPLAEGGADWSKWRMPVAQGMTGNPEKEEIWVSQR